LLAYAARKFLYQALSRGYNQWEEWYLTVKEQERNIRRSLARWIKNKLSMAFNTWLQWYEQLLAERVALRRAASKWAADGLLWAFTLWREGRMESQLELHSRAALFWLNQVMGAAWRTWRETCEKNRTLWRIIRKIEMRHERERDELLEEIARLRKLLGDRTYLPRPVIEYDDDDSKVLKAIKMWQHLGLARGYNTLKYALEAARRNRSLGLRTMTYWCNQQLTKGFNSWRAYYFEILALKRSTMFWKNRSLAAAWNTWLELIEELHHQRQCAYNAVMRWRHMQLYAGFHSWRQILTDGIRRKNAMLRAVLRWGGSELFAAFGYWRETAEKIRVAELEFRAYLTKSYDPAERSRSRSRTSSPARQRGFDM
jgi:hypothetical protein